MNRTTQTVWRSGATHSDLLVETSPGQFYIPLSHVTPEQLTELALAIADALKNPAPEAAPTAN